MNRQLPLIEKYRPSKLDDIKNQEDIKSIFIDMVNNRNIPHMVFYGSAGTGKTSSAIAICKQLYKDTYNDNVLELNASDERGIRVVREKIKTFSQKTTDTDFKIIILDEADAMTNDSQFALRRIIELYTHSTRFILICNYVTKIIEPLTSRCAKFRFQVISTVSISEIIKNISIKENIIINDNVIETLFKITKGDLRKVINLLQRASYINNIIDSDLLIDISGQIPEKQIEEIWNIIINKETDHNKLFKLVCEIINEGYSSIILLNNLFEKTINDVNISDINKRIIILIISKIYYELIDNANETIQLLYLFNEIRNHYSITKTI